LTNNQYFQFKTFFDTNYFTDQNAPIGFPFVSDVNITYTAAGGGGTCDCPASGDWTISDGSICALTTKCVITGNLHITNGKLALISGSILSLPLGKKVIIEITNSQFIINNGAKIIVYNQ
jgi:hypothetical protein